MKELLYTVLELEEWNQRATCSFCHGFNRKSRPAVCQIRTRSKLTNKLVDNGYACEECKEILKTMNYPSARGAGDYKRTLTLIFTVTNISVIMLNIKRNW